MPKFNIGILDPHDFTLHLLLLLLLLVNCLDDGIDGCLLLFDAYFDDGL